MPVGAVARIDEKFLAETVDELILTLLALMEHVYASVAKLYKGKAALALPACAFCEKGGTVLCARFPS